MQPEEQPPRAGNSPVPRCLFQSHYETVRHGVIVASARSMANEANLATPPTVRWKIVRCTWPALDTMLHSELEPRPREQIGRVSATRDGKPENAGSLKPHYIAWYPFHVKRISRAGGMAGERQLLHRQHYPETRNGLLQRGMAHNIFPINRFIVFKTCIAAALPNSWNYFLASLSSRQATALENVDRLVSNVHDASALGIGNAAGVN